MRTVGQNQQINKRWTGHIIRGNGVLKDMVEGRVDGKTPREKKRIGMFSDLKKDGMPTENRELW